MFQRILVPLDGSEGAERAIPVAACIARASGGSIVFIRVVLPIRSGTQGAGLHGRGVATPEVEVSAKDLADVATYLTATTAAYADELAGVATEMDVAGGTTSEIIFSAARLEHVDLIVMCSRGESGLKRWVLGSVAQQAVQHSPVSVLVLNAHGQTLRCAQGDNPLRVLVPLDGSALSETAIAPAVQLITMLAAPSQGELHLLRVVDLPSAYGKIKSQAFITDSMQEEARKEAETYVEAVADRLRAAFKLNITSSVVVNTDVAGTIIKQAEQTEDAEHPTSYNVIAMATHGRGGLRRLVMGSVTEHILGTTKLPLLIVRPQDPKAKQEKPGETTQVEVRNVEIQRHCHPESPALSS